MVEVREGRGEESKDVGVDSSLSPFHRLRLCVLGEGGEGGGTRGGG